MAGLFVGGSLDISKLDRLLPHCSHLAEVSHGELEGDVVLEVAGEGNRLRSVLEGDGKGQSWGSCHYRAVTSGTSLPPPSTSAHDDHQYGRPCAFTQN